MVQTVKSNLSIKTIKMRSKIVLIFTTLLLILVIASCEKNGENETKISSIGSDESHKNGENCMSCHKSGGEGEGWFIVAGSVYDSLKSNPNPNGFVDLYTEPNGGGTLVKHFEVDGLGNFYSTESVNFGAGLYPVVLNSSGKKRFMGSAITSAACNSCHGVSTDRIWNTK